MGWFETGFDAIKPSTVNILVKPETCIALWDGNVLQMARWAYGQSIVHSLFCSSTSPICFLRTTLSFSSSIIRKKDGLMNGMCRSHTVPIHSGAVGSHYGTDAAMSEPTSLTIICFPRTRERFRGRERRKGSNRRASMAGQALQCSMRKRTNGLSMLNAPFEKTHPWVHWLMIAESNKLVSFFIVESKIFLTVV